VSVAQHLGIRLSEYDHRIRTFGPYYQEMLEMVADTVLATCGKAPTITDLGIGTGALSARCLDAMPRATIYGIDTDPGILAAARRRLARHASRVHLSHGDFVRAPIPRSDAIVATLALHHIFSLSAKGRFYRRCVEALRPGGILVIGDVFLADDARRTKHELGVWHRHMERSYGARQTRAFLRAWSKEDRYFTNGRELGLLHDAGFDADIVWRRPPFAILVGKRRGTRRRDA
jgi:SAM-dependent methyltransferase